MESGSGSGNQQFLLRQGVSWLKTNLPKLIEDLATKMADTPDLPVHRLPSFLRRAVAKDMLQDLIKRFESNSFDAEAVRKKMIGALKKGASLKDLVTSVDLMVEVITLNARPELNDSPAVRDVLLTKTAYFATLIKSTIANAAIEHEKGKISKL